MLHPDGRPFQPVEYPLPALTIDSLQFRVVASDARDKFTLRLTPAMPLGNGAYAPSSDTHIDVNLSPETLNQMFEMFASAMTQEQKTLARAALSDIDVPPKPSIILPGDNA